MEEIKKMRPREYIKIRGARENNLKDIDVDIPRNELVVLTGMSGSGKSSWLLIPFMPGGTEKIYGIACPPMQDSSWARWKSLMWTESMVCPLPFP